MHVSAWPDCVDLLLYAGDDFYLDLTVLNRDGSPADLAGASASAIVRPDYGSMVVASFSATIAANVISLYLPAAATATLPETGVWDCQVTTGTSLLTVATGTVRVAAQVTM